MLRPALLLAAVLAFGCSDPTPTPKWFYSCGDPVCHGHRAEPVAASCTTQVVGEACGPAGSTCDPIDACNRRLVCSSDDPAMSPGGCPISRAEHKADIVYVDAGESRRLRDRALHLRIATWRYKADPARERRLGFVIDDAGPGPEVRTDGEHVDLYGYTSLAIVALQEQQREIDALRSELTALRGEIARIRR